MSDTQEWQVLANWSEEAGQARAKELAIRLGKKHWQVIYLLRDFYSQYQTVPNNRVLTKVMKQQAGWGEDCGQQLRTLFGTANPAAQATYIAGLPVRPCLQEAGLNRPPP